MPPDEPRLGDKAPVRSVFNRRVEQFSTSGLTMTFHELFIVGNPADEVAGFD